MIRIFLSQESFIFAQVPPIISEVLVSATSCSGQNVPAVWQREINCVHLSILEARRPWHGGASGCDGPWPGALRASVASLDAVSTTQCSIKVQFLLMFYVDFSPPLSQCPAEEIDCETMTTMFFSCRPVQAQELQE